MKVKLLKEIRQGISKYNIKQIQDENGAYKWTIYIYGDLVLAYHKYDTLEEAQNYLRTLWHEDAEEYLKEHKNERKQKTIKYENNN